MAQIRYTPRFDNPVVPSIIDTPTGSGFAHCGDERPESMIRWPPSRASRSFNKLALPQTRFFMKPVHGDLLRPANTPANALDLLMIPTPLPEPKWAKR